MVKIKISFCEFFVYFDEKKRYDLSRTFNQIGVVYDSQKQNRAFDLNARRKLYHHSTNFKR